MGQPETLVGPALADAEGIGALTLGGLLAEQCARFSDHEALVLDDPLLDDATVRWTYRDLDRTSGRVAAALVARGVGAGDRVGILMGNRPEAVASLFGIALAGAVAVPLSTFSPRPELAFMIEHSDIGTLLLQTTMGSRSFAADAAELCPDIAVALGPDARGLQSWDEFLVAPDAELPTVDPSDAGVIIYSSGTTDRPKGVMLSQRAVALQCWLQAGLFGRDETTRVWCALPMFWTAGLNLAMGATLAGGSTWIMQEKFDAGQALHLIERERVTEPHTFSHQARALEEHPDWATTDLSSCTRVFGKSVFTRHPTVVGDPTWNMPIGYGLSETSSFVTGLPSTTPREILRNGSYGRLLPGSELRVVDPETGDALSAGQEGELIVRGPTLMEHYVGRPAAECFDADGFFHTGDLGSFDADGFVYFGGRNTEMIKTGGANVSPAEIEVHLHAYEPVKLARAIGIPDDRRDEIAVLCVELKDRAEATEDDIKAYLRERLAAYKVPAHVLFFEEDEIPMNRSGTKVQTDRLRAVVQERLAR